MSKRKPARTIKARSASKIRSQAGRTDPPLWDDGQHPVQRLWTDIGQLGSSLTPPPLPSGHSVVQAASVVRDRSDR
jgi:hypothetical protein